MLSQLSSLLMLCKLFPIQNAFSAIVNTPAALVLRGRLTSFPLKHSCVNLKRRKTGSNSSQTSVRVSFFQHVNRRQILDFCERKTRFFCVLTSKVSAFAMRREDPCSGYTNLVVSFPSATNSRMKQSKTKIAAMQTAK